MVVSAQNKRCSYLYRISYEKFCSSYEWYVSIGFDEDKTYEDAGILCNGNPTIFCVYYNNRYTIITDSCLSRNFKYYFSQSGLDVVIGCAKKYNKGGGVGPSGYTKKVTNVLK